MKRSGPPERKTPLKPGKAPERKTAWSVPTSGTSMRHRNQGDRHHQQKRRPARNTGPSAKVRELVAVRSQGWCEWPGCWLVASDLHHRLNRKQGGRRGEAATRINQAAWLLHACRPHHDAVTSPVGEARALARESGWLLHEHEDALTVPVLSRHGLVLLANDGTATPAIKTEEES
jgi:hypothetical protein